MLDSTRLRALALQASQWPEPAASRALLVPALPASLPRLKALVSPALQTPWVWTAQAQPAFPGSPVSEQTPWALPAMLAPSVSLAPRQQASPVPASQVSQVSLSQAAPQPESRACPPSLTAACSPALPAQYLERYSQE